MSPCGREAVTRPRGSFGYQAVIGLTPHYWGPGVYRDPVMGLPAAGQHIFGAMQADGRRFFPVRHFQNEIAARFLMYEAPEKGSFSFDSSSDSAYMGLCDEDVIDGRWGVRQPGRHMRFALTTNEHSGWWREKDFVDVTLTPCLSALQFAVPDASDPLAYLARLYEVSAGTVQGHQVERGFVFHEQVYLRSGQGWALSKYKKELQGGWVAFATRFADDSTAWGQVCWGPSGWGFAIIQRSDADPILVHRPCATTEFAQDGYPECCTFDLRDGGIWEWEPLVPGQGRIPLPGPPEVVPCWSEGVMRPAGETREVVFATSWTEVYPARLSASG